MRWERIKSGKGFPVKQIFDLRKKFKQRYFDCCWHFTVPVYISCFPVLFKFVSFNYWHIALMRKKSANEFSVLETCQRDSQKLKWQEIKKIRKLRVVWFLVIIHCYSQLQEQEFKMCWSRRWQNSTFIMVEKKNNIKSITILTAK